MSDMILNPPEPKQVNLREQTKYDRRIAEMEHKRHHKIIMLMKERKNGTN